MSRKKRKRPVRSTDDDDFTLGELIGLPDASDKLAIDILLNGISTKAEAASYRKRQEVATAKAREAALWREGKKAHTARDIVVAVARAKAKSQDCLYPSQISAARDIVADVNSKIEYDDGDPISLRTIRSYVPDDVVRPRKPRR
jgi:hypothetical protein